MKDKRTEEVKQLDATVEARRESLLDQARSDDIDEVVDAVGELADMGEWD